MRYPTLFLVLAIVCCVGDAGYAQTPGLAVRYFDAGEKKMQLGDCQVRRKISRKRLT